MPKAAKRLGRFSVNWEFLQRTRTAGTLHIACLVSLLSSALHTGPDTWLHFMGQAGGGWLGVEVWTGG